jgi:probable rRNA maturation factor
MPTIHCRNDLRRSVALGQAQSVLSLTLVGDEAIRALNRKYRGKDKPTDVLSFALHEDGGAQGERLLGDVVISVETARRQAEEYGAPLQRELERLLIHGILHLVGHDHHEAGERRRMRREERRLAACIGMPWPY